MNAVTSDLQRLASQRVAGRGGIAVEADAHPAIGTRTRLVRLYQEGAAKLRMPRRDGTGLEAVLINTAGGLTGGDRLTWDVSVGAGAALTTTTQASEKVYRSAGGEARVTATAEIGAGGRLAWLPQETILYEGSALARRLDVTLGKNAEALLVEAIVLGRKAHGETVTRARFRESWRVRAGGRLVHADELSLGPDIASLTASRATLGGATAFATVLAVGGDAEPLLAEVRDICGEAGGASFWRVAGTGKLLARLVAEDGYALRGRLVPLLRLLNGRAELPKLWSS
jgi:urease accessory protein